MWLRLPHVSLNPFEIRAGVKYTTMNLFDIINGLNPFEIRAGVKSEKSQS